MNRPEQALQVVAIRWLRLALPSAIVFHVPNGGARSETEAKILKGMGVLAGVADIMILAGGKPYCIELKADKGKSTPGQRAFEANCGLQGIPYATCRSLAEVEGTIAGWGLKARARVAA